jgi:hypothetical protein
MVLEWQVGSGGSCFRKAAKRTSRRKQQPIESVRMGSLTNRVPEETCSASRTPYKRAEARKRRNRERQAAERDPQRRVGPQKRTARHYTCNYQQRPRGCNASVMTSPPQEVAHEMNIGPKG